MKDPHPFIALERRLGRLMLAGVTVSAACLLSGVVLFLARPGTASGTAVITCGLVTLMVTPALRVAVAIIEAVRLRDWFFVAATASVILLLALTLLLSIARLG